MKSHVSALTEVAVNIIKDVTAMCAAKESAERDIETLMSRIEDEGISFLTITLPAFGQDFEKSLSQGHVGPENFRAFRKFRRIPAFLRGIVGQVFDADTGEILSDPSVSAVKGVRQIAYTFKKLKLACSPIRVRRAYRGYLQDEHDLSVRLSSDLITEFVSVSKVLWSGLGTGALKNVLDLVPRHGPGATVEKISGNQKFIFRSWHERLERYFPLDSCAFANVNAFESDEFKRITLVPSDDELPVRVITVPKTLKAPRIIAIEPVCMQYTQQAISRELVSFLETYDITAGHVNFSDQSVNQRLAITSSMDGRLATIDMTSASDRVPLSLAIRMFDANVDYQRSILACRSRRAQLPTGDIITLKKFASMGSALCFPIESMYFYTLCVAALLRKRNLPVTSRNIFKVSRDVYVYGDDLIVPTDDAESVVAYLQKYYCKVGRHKSFWSGSFRESCGMDAFRGERVTPVYLRETPPDNRRDGSSLISWVKTSNLLYKEGYWLTSSYLISRCEAIIGKLPIVDEDSEGLGKVSFQRYRSIERWGGRYQRPEVRSWVARPVYRTDRLAGYPALLKCLVQLQNRESGDATDQKHLSRTARHGAVTLKRRWISPFGG